MAPGERTRCLSLKNPLYQPAGLVNRTTRRGVRGAAVWQGKAGIRREARKPGPSQDRAFGKARLARRGGSLLSFPPFALINPVTAGDIATDRAWLWLPSELLKLLFHKLVGQRQPAVAPKNAQTHRDAVG